MALSSGSRLVEPHRRDHGFHRLGVGRVRRETADASSLVLDIPPDLAPAYRYEPGQFLTFRCRIDGQPYLRCYSMSSTPGVDPDLQVTVKRVAGGAVSNWMLDSLRPGDPVEATRPAGVFGRRSGDGDVLAFAGGSGITPVLSVLKAILADTPHRARLFYANRDPSSVIFGAALAALVEGSGGRLEVVHHLDSEGGLVRADELEAFLSGGGGVDSYVCGPAPFMELVEATLTGGGASADTIHIERFEPRPEEGPAKPDPADAGPAQVTIEMDGRVDVAEHRPGTTVLQTARQLGMAPPFSCEAGNCATCMAKVTAGAVTMTTNNALTDEEVAEGWILTCQSVPSTLAVRVVYGGGD